MMGLPIKWWFLGGGLLLTLWLVWQAPPATDNDTEVITTVQPIVKPDSGEIETQSQSPVLVERQSPEMISDLFRTPPNPIVVRDEVPQATISSKQEALPPIPFRYIGRMEKNESLIVFVMDGNALHILEAGDSPREDYQLEAIDLAAGELRWRHLPTQKIRNMDIQP